MCMRRQRQRMRSCSVSARTAWRSSAISGTGWACRSSSRLMPREPPKRQKLAPFTDIMPGHLCSLVPGQRAAKLRWQCRDRPGDGIANRFSPMTGKRRPVLHARDGAVAFHSGKMQQHCEPRGAFHQSADRRSAQADDQVTFPVSGYGPISCFRRSFTDHDLRRDEGFAPPAATCPRHALRNLSTTLRHRRFLFTDSFLLLWKWRVG